MNGCCGHMTNKCNLMNTADKHHIGENSNWHSCNSNKSYKQYSNPELNAIISRSTKEALEKLCRKPCDQEKVNNINQFITLSVFSSDSSNGNRVT
eukprot:8606454-Ditylum_brightwellii.AAC.1